MAIMIAPQTTASLTRHPTGGVHPVRNPLNQQLSPQFREPVQVHAANGAAGGSVRCTNRDRIYAAMLKITCWLN